MGGDKMKRILVLLFTLLLALSVVACSAQNATEPSAPAETATPAPTPEETSYDFGGMTITLAWPWDPRYTEPSDETDRFNARVAEVEQKLNIDFQWIAVDGGEFYDNMVANTMAGDNFGDIMFCQPWIFPEWIKAGLVADLGPIAESVDIDLSDPSWNSLARTETTYDGVQYGMDKFTKEVNAGVIFNKRLVEEAGLPSPYEQVDNDTWTWDTLQQYAKALTVADADGTVEQWGFTSMNQQAIADMLVVSNYGDIVDRDTQTVIADSENTLEALALYQQMVAVDKTVRMGDPDDWESNIKAFAEGTVGMMLAEQWVIDYINTMEPEDFGYVYFPKGPKADDYVSQAGFFEFWIPDNIPLERQQAALLAFSMIFDNLYPEMSLDDYYKMVAEKYLQDEEGAAIYADIQERNLFRTMGGDVYGVDSWALYDLLKTLDYTPQSAVAEQKPVMEATIADYLANN
jgi:multiple sugar transport system substrate-binding protein